MSKQTGAKIKEARLAAGMTQADVAKKVEGLSAQDLSKAERGLLDLTQKQLQAVAKAVGVSANSLTSANRKTGTSAKTKSASAAKKSTAGRTSGSTASEKTLKLTADEKKLVELYRAADKETKNAAKALLKGEQQDASLMDTMMNMLGGMIGGSGKADSGKAQGDDNPMSGMMSMFGDLLGGIK